MKDPKAMRTYRFQLLTSTSQPSWQYDTEFVSLQMALDYGKAIAKQLHDTPWFMGMLVWQMAGDKEEDAVLVGHFTIARVLSVIEHSVSPQAS